MFLIILAVVCLTYILAALLASVAIFKVAKRKSWAMLSFVLILIAPVHEGVFGHPTFEKFDAQHPGVPIPAPTFVEGFLVEGRRAFRPMDAFKADSVPGAFRYKEFPREMVESINPAPRAPLDEFVQFFLTTSADPLCTQVFDAPGSQLNCVGVSSSVEPRSEFAVLEEPDERNGRIVFKLNDSKLFPIIGGHTRVRRIQTNTVVAEVWQFGMPSKVFPRFAWFAKQNPPGRSHAALALASVPTAVR